jgi:hypothetical protein
MAGLYEVQLQDTGSGQMLAECLEFGIVARLESGSLYVATPASMSRVYAEDWVLVDMGDGWLTPEGQALEGEVCGLMQELKEVLR